MQTLEQAQESVKDIINNYREASTCTPLYWKDTYQTIDEITPLEAKIILNSHHIENNRKERKGATQSLNFEINQDRWIPIASTIKFSTEGKLIDGQHRLSAISQQEKTIQVIIQHNVPKHVIHFLDNNVKRSAADIFMFSGQFKKTGVAKNSQQLTALLVFLQEQGHHLAINNSGGVQTSLGSNHHKSSKSKTVGRSVSEYLNYYAEHKQEIDETVQWVNSNIKDKHKLLNVSRVSCAYHLFRFIDKVAAQEYIKNIFNQTGLEEKTTEYRVYEHLLNAKSGVAKLFLNGKEREETLYHGFWLSHIKKQTHRQIKVKFTETEEIKKAFNAGNHSDIEFLPSREIYTIFREKYDKRLLKQGF